MISNIFTNTNKTTFLSALAASLMLTAITSAAQAKGFAQQHPWRAEVLRRDNNINQRVNNDYGHLGGHYGQLERQDWQIRRQEQADASANGGHLTSGEYGQLNREENALSQETRMDNTHNPFVQNHPRRAEVLSRDANLDYRINKDEGHLGGQYSHLESEDRSIYNQEQADARANGGHITSAEQSQLNHEENALSEQVRMDNTKNPFVQNHPRRAEVLSRDANLNYSINKDEGHLNGQYGNLMQEDRSIANQERQDARANGGHITRSEQAQLNQEETALRSQIRQDHSQLMQPFQTSVVGTVQQ